MLALKCQQLVDGVEGLALQAAALLLLAAVWGGSVIWFAPVISEALCLVMALVFMTRFWRKTPDPAQIS